MKIQEAIEKAIEGLIVFPKYDTIELCQHQKDKFLGIKGNELNL